MSLLCASEQNSSYTVEIPSNYITKYIQQRKQLLLAKLQEALIKGTQDNSIKMQNQLQQQPQIKRQFFRQSAKKRVKVYEEIMTPSNSKNSHNKIIEQDFYKKNNNPSKFILRTNLYEHQRQLKRKIQKSKQNYQLNTEHTFTPNVYVKNSSQKREKQQKQPIVYSYQQKHEQKKSNKPIQIIKNTKSLFKKSADLFKKVPKQLQQSQQSIETTTNWKRIQQYFSKLTLSPSISASTKQKLASLSEKKLLFEQNLLIIRQFQELFENESDHDKREEEQIKMFINKLQKQEDQISVIAVEEQKKQDLDTSNIIENVVKSMRYENEQQSNKDQIYVPKFIQQMKEFEEKTITISDHPVETMQQPRASFKLSFEDPPIAEKQGQQIAIQNIKTQEEKAPQIKQQQSQLSKNILNNEIQKAQSKIMDDNSQFSEQINIQVEQSFCKQLNLLKEDSHEVSKIQALNQLIQAEDKAHPNPVPHNDDQLRKTHTQMFPEEDKSIQFQQEEIRVTLLTLADQFVRCSVRMIDNQPYEQSDQSSQHWQDEDIFTKQEQYTVTSISSMDFTQFIRPKHIGDLIIHMKRQIQKPLQPPPQLSRQQFDDQDSPPQLRMDKHSMMSSVRDFGQCYYLVIPEEQFQESVTQ